MLAYTNASQVDDILYLDTNVAYKGIPLRYKSKLNLKNCAEIFYELLA